MSSLQRTQYERQLAAAGAALFRAHNRADLAGWEGERCDIDMLRREVSRLLSDSISGGRKRQIRGQMCIDVQEA